MHYLYRNFDANNNLLYIGQSYNLHSRIDQHKTWSNWFNLVTKIEIERFESRTLACQAEKNAIIKENPKYNMVHSKINKTPKKIALGEVLESAKNAKNRRAKLLDEFNRLGLTQSKFAKVCGVSRSRINKLLNMAVAEQ